MINFSISMTVRNLQKKNMQHFKEKYGMVRVESIGKDQKSLDKVGGTMMSGTYQ